MNDVILCLTKWVKLIRRSYISKDDTVRDWDFVTRTNKKTNSSCADAVVIVPFIRDENDNKKMVVIKQFRPPINDYIIEHPAGLIDENESLINAAKRELKEETGLEIDLVTLTLSEPLYTSPGLTDESCNYVFCNAKGSITKKHQENSEDIEILTLTREEIKDILLSDVKKSARCALIMNFFINKYLM